MQPRPYQVKALNRIVEEFNSGIQRTLLVMATGLGKTILVNGISFYFAYNQDRTPTGKKVLVMAHQNILIDQAAEKFEKAVNVQVSREKGKTTCLGSPYPITVSSVQTMCRRLSKFDEDYFDLIIIDEAHHSESKQYKKVLKHFKSAKVLGVTATPDRADKKNLKLFQSVAFRYSIEEAQRDGYLAPIKVEKVALDIDLSEVKRKKGDFDDSSLGATIEGCLNDIAKQVRPMTYGRKIVCFVPLIDTARKAEKSFKNYGFKSVSISGEESKERRKEILKAFEDGEYDIIFNAMLLCEGYDCPQVDCVIVLRPTTSRALYVQMVGRGLRLAEGKKDCLLIDFLFQHEGFDLAGPQDILETKPLTQKSPSHFGKGGGGGGGQAESAEERLIRKLNEAAKKYKRELVKALATYPEVKAETLKENELLGLQDGTMSDWQENELIQRGIDPTGLTFGMASKVIRRLKQEEDRERKPSSKQIWRLRQLKVSEEKISKMSFIEAQKELQRLKALGRW